MHSIGDASRASGGGLLISKLSDTLSSDICRTLDTTWQTRAGQVVPSTEDVALENGAVRLSAVVLYADLARSTRLALKNRSSAAKIVRAYLSTMTRLVKSSGGEVRSFDGDRVMGVFIGERKESAAADCALKMNHVVAQMLRPRVSASFRSMRGVSLKHCVGIASSDVLVVRGGIRDNNDLVFVGAAPNIAANLSEIRNAPWSIYVTAEVYGKLNRKAKLSASGENFWTLTTRKVAGKKMELYKSSWRRRP